MVFCEFVYQLIPVLFFCSLCIIYINWCLLFEITQTWRLRSFSNVDNSPASLLAFSGNNNVHALYDFLLNYRFLLTSLSSVDVPVLCSPVPFQNSALSSLDVCPWLNIDFVYLYGNF
ncbi:hypothetical protein D0Y65_006467 [Glycine soja]|uniref:Uncharacterized protein n=1 Tax=Glycine soja TaxID=3848 RepID=A0A445L8N5_GLYSO|nr:hypothetical protein D0Y65_006467 [Glycine soja]